MWKSSDLTYSLSAAHLGRAGWNAAFSDTALSLGDFPAPRSVCCSGSADGEVGFALQSCGLLCTVFWVFLISEAALHPL